MVAKIHHVMFQYAVRFVRHIPFKFFCFDYVERLFVAVSSIVVLKICTW